ncbi:MAG: FAD:protein FMN transferase [Verrucomicrobiae bacterium]|nr:FAD:protein FMN transferase [Verrucomicrobiae bacterium]
MVLSNSNENGGATILSPFARVIYCFIRATGLSPLLWAPSSIVLAAIVSLASCNRSEPETETAPPTETDSPALLTFQQAHMGTQFTIRIWADAGAHESAKGAADEAFARIANLEMVFSDYEVDSEAVRLTTKNPPGEPIPLSSDLFHVLVKTETLSRETGGAFDITIGPMVRLWRQARKNHRLPTPEAIAQARERTGWQKLEIDRETPSVTLGADYMQLDFGGIAKGYSADEALTILKQRGFSRSLVAASGDIVVGDPPPGEHAWRIGIRSLDAVLANDPDHPLTGAVNLANGAISTSGDTQQAVNIDGVRYSHIVDPKTALGLTHRIAVSVIGPDATTTDSYATTVSVLGREKGLAFIESKPGIECLVFEADEDGNVTTTKSSGFPEVSEAPD